MLGICSVFVAEVKGVIIGIWMVLGVVMGVFVTEFYLFWDVKFVLKRAGMICIGQLLLDEKIQILCEL